MAQYQECIKWLAKTSKRSDEAISADHNNQWFRMFCGFQMEDNWVHVRFLIEALRVEGEERSEHDKIAKLVSGAEKVLVAVFALIRCGADDPLPWLIVLDGVLRLLWRQLGLASSSGEPTLVQKKLFGELALWCHGTAVNAFVVRLPHTNARYVKGQKLMVCGRTKPSIGLDCLTDNAIEQVVQDGVDLQSSLCQRRLHASAHPSITHCEQGSP
jgi:hypothetical protein